MSHVTENSVRLRRRSGRQLTFQPDTEHDVLANNVIDETSYNSQFWNRTDRIFSFLLGGLAITMHRSTKTALIAITILVCVIVVIVLLNLESIKSSFNDDCIKVNEEETCHTTDKDPYRYYGTKTAYHIAREDDDSFPTLNIGECVPKVFYLLSRHATRYPDKEDIEEMIKLLPGIQQKIHNNSLIGEVNLCKEDLDRLKDWTEPLKPEFDNKMSATGIKETIELAERFKAKFPTLLNKNYSPDKFIFEFTSRERTRSTAEAFASGLFGEDYKRINFDNSTNDDVLQFHKECKVLQKKCKDPNYDTSEIEKFEKSPLMQKVINSISGRIGVPLTYDDIKIIHKACSFGFALDTGDVWCSLFTQDELKVLEFNDDIDDYYKDAYGNKVNYEQACPMVEHIMNLFNSSSSESKAFLQFSHAGGVKKVYSLFGLFHDQQPLMADNFCSQQSRAWQSSIIAPFTTNLALVLYKCGTEKKIAAYHNEKPIKLGGCTDYLCSYDEFFKMYNPIADKCDIKSICCTCCKI